MTTVAWDGETLSADKQATIGYRKIMEPLPKIKKITFKGADALVGISGDIDFAWKIVDWIESSEDDPPEFEEDEQNSCVILIQDGVYIYNSAGMGQFFGDIKWSIGSGGDFAMGAMEAGASSFAAVEIASRLDVYSGMGIDTIRL